MGNRLAGEVSFDVAGATYTLKLGVNELLGLQSELGVENDQEFLSGLGARVRSLRDLRELFRYALAKHHPDMTPELAGDLMTAVGMQRSADLMLEAIRWAFPDPAASGGAPAGKAKARSAGKPS